MMNLLQILGGREFPWTAVAIGVALGLLFASGVRLALWKKEDPGIHINLGVALAGSIVGAFLGICYHVVVEHCGLTLGPSVK